MAQENPFCAHSAVQSAHQFSEELCTAFNSVPCGLCVYQVDGTRLVPLFHNPAFYAIMGYSSEHIRSVERETSYLGVHPDDLAPLQAGIEQALRLDREFRHSYRVWNDAAQEYRWIDLNASVKRRAEGGKLVYAVYSDVSEQRRLEAELTRANEELDHLVNTIPGGIASYRVEEGRFIPSFCSDGVLALSGHDREEFAALIGDNALNTIYEQDRTRVEKAAMAALESGEVLDVSYRMRHRNGRLIWLHLNGRRMGPLSEHMRFYAVFTGMSEETRLFQSIANETADGIYVIDRENYDLLYINEEKKLFRRKQDCVGQKCYAALHGKDAPCAFCTLKSHAPDGRAHSMDLGVAGRFYSTRFRETDWNGIPAYVKYIQDVTEEVRTRKEAARLEQYFHTLVKNLPGGVAVVRYEADGSMSPEYISEGFAELTGMSVQEAWSFYQQDALVGVHPEDRAYVAESIGRLVDGGERSCEIQYRLKQGDNGYVWVKNTMSIILSEGGGYTIYASYRDLTREREEQELLRQQYNEIILQHYRAPGPNALIVGHCNVTQNRILEIIDHTDSDLLKTFGSGRDDFFTGIASLVTDEDEHSAFLNTYLNKPSLAAFGRGVNEMVLDCFIKLPKEAQGRYVQFLVNLVETPDTGDITGILTVTDITEQTIFNRILNKLSSTGYDLVADVDLRQDRCVILSGGADAGDVPNGRHSERVAYILEHQVVPRDKELVEKLLDPAYMLDRLEREGAYSFPYSIMGKKGEVRAKNLTVSLVDSRLKRICLARTDITESVREQQGLLSVIVYTFELIAFIDIDRDLATLHSRKTVLENLPPFVVEGYSGMLDRLTAFYDTSGGREEVESQFRLETMLQRLEESPAGYDFVLPHCADGEPRYKQITVFWSDGGHKTVCMVRADVTDMLTAERQRKTALEKALTQAEEANRAKCDFLSSMSHDIRTPMNAIIGMTALAEAHLDERDRVEEYLRKISISSQHLLSLINDILDMSKIERGKITLNHNHISLPELVEQLSAIMAPQARSAGLRFDIPVPEVGHPYFYGDALRIKQIFINLLSNAVKFTPEGGEVSLHVEETASLQGPEYVRYRFTVSDTGIGVPEEFLDHVFEPFTRSRSTQRVEGTGLGLSITKGLVDLMDGRILVESRACGGSIFRIELECQTAGDGADALPAPAAAPAASGSGKVLAGRRFLVAEDNDINAEILCELLQMHGAESVVAQDGVQALREFQHAAPGTYSGILMDIRMPEMNGYEATRAIRRLERADAVTVPIIAMTANAFAEDIQAAMEAGMSAHVAKPIDIQVLLATLGKVIS